MLVLFYTRVGELEGQRGITELAYTLLASLPRSRLAVLQARIAPLLKLDIVGVSTFALVGSMVSWCYVQRYRALGSICLLFRPVRSSAV